MRVREREETLLERSRSVPSRVSFRQRNKTITSEMSIFRRGLFSSKRPDKVSRLGDLSVDLSTVLHRTQLYKNQRKSEGKFRVKIFHVV